MQKRANAEMKFSKSRNNLLAVVAFSVVNVILTLAGSGVSFLFSATFPMFSVEIGDLLAKQSGNKAYLTAAVIVAFIAIGFYFVCFLFSKEHKTFILVALVLFGLDTLLLLWILSSSAFDISALIDVAFHAWVLYYLIIGVKAWSDLKNLPFEYEREEIEIQEENQEMP